MVWRWMFPAIPAMKGSCRSFRRGLQLHCINVIPAAADLGVPDGDLAEEEAAGLADGAQAAVQARAEELLCAHAVDHEDAQAGADLPHVLEGDPRELAAPAEGQRDGAQRSQHGVAAVT